MQNDDKEFDEMLKMIREMIEADDEIGKKESGSFPSGVDCMGCFYLPRDPESRKEKGMPKKNYSDAVSHPDHYCEGRKYEPKDVIADWDLDFFLGSAVKYISRAGRKPGNSKKQDLEKAIQYLKFEIEKGEGRDKV